MAEPVSLLRGTDGVTKRDNTDKVPTFNLTEELKSKDVWSVANQRPALNVQNFGASIW